jgi:hypothetical protein
MQRFPIRQVLKGQYLHIHPRIASTNSRRNSKYLNVSIKKRDKKYRESQRQSCIKE